MFNFLKSKREKIKDELKNIFLSLKNINDQNIQRVSARYEVALKNLLKKEFKNRKLDFQKYEKIENEMKKIYNNSELKQNEKWSQLSKMKKDPEYQKFVEVKKYINSFSFELFKENKNLSECRDNFISKIGLHKDSMKFHENKNILFRSLRVSNEQELKEMFENGIYPQVLALDVYQTPTNLPYVNDAALNENIEQVGFTGGVISLSSAAHYSLHFANESIKRGAKEDFYLLAINPRKVANVGEHIHKEVGYSGKNESNAQASEEFVSTSARPEDIYGARKLNKDGSIEQLIFNKNVLNAKSDFIGDKEFIKYAAFNHVDEYIISEYLEQPKTFEKIYGIDELKNVEKKVEIMKKDDPKRFEEIQSIAEMDNPNDHRKDFHRANSEDSNIHKNRYHSRRNKIIEVIIKNTLGIDYKIPESRPNSRSNSIIDSSDIDMNIISSLSNGKNDSNFVRNLEVERKNLEKEQIIR
jgi:hypothetical protein